MTTTCGSGATPPRFSRENAPSAPTVERLRRYAAVAAAERVPGRTPFGACLEQLGAERRAARLGTALAGASGPPAAAPDAPADTARDPRTGADDGADRGFSGSDAVPVGADATIDPMVSILFSLAPRAAPAGASILASPLAVPLGAAAPPPPMELLMAKLVRRIAWSGNARTGCARLELGAGVLDGATLTIHADDGVVRVALDTPPGVDREAWRERIGERLAARGLHVEAIDVA